MGEARPQLRDGAGVGFDADDPLGAGSELGGLLAAVGADVEDGAAAVGGDQPFIEGTLPAFLLEMPGIAQPQVLGVKGGIVEPVGVDQSVQQAPEPGWTGLDHGHGPDAGVALSPRGAPMARQATPQAPDCR